MDLTKTSGLPPLDPSPVHTQITILSNEGEYVAYIVADEGAFRIPIRLKPYDVKNLNLLLQEVVQRVASSFGRENIYDAALSELARVGNYAFRSIFSDPAAQQVIRDALQEGTVVQIVSRDFFVPWELLYDGPLDERASAANYWGMKYIISRRIIQEKRPGAHLPCNMDSRRPKVGLIAYDRLPFVEKLELPALKTLHQKKRIQLVPLRSLSMSLRHAELAELGRFLSQEIHVLHFACHAYEQDPIEKSYLFITNDFSVSLIDFVVGGYALQYSPFVILNACLTSVINPLYTSSWAEKLWEHGARGVLATDFRVPDDFAATFSNTLYLHLLTGMTIGETLLSLRRSFWNELRNPLGLAYALYSSPSIKIVKTRRK
jgi:hypothetical protein